MYNGISEECNGIDCVCCCHQKLLNLAHCSFESEQGSCWAQTLLSSYINKRWRRRLRVRSFLLHWAAERCPQKMSCCCFSLCHTDLVGKGKKAKQVWVRRRGQSAEETNSNLSAHTPFSWGAIHCPQRRTCSARGGVGPPGGHVILMMEPQVIGST